MGGPSFGWVREHIQTVILWTPWSEHSLRVSWTHHSYWQMESHHRVGLATTKAGLYHLVMQPHGAHPPIKLSLVIVFGQYKSPTQAAQGKGCVTYRSTTNRQSRSIHQRPQQLCESSGFQPKAILLQPMMHLQTHQREVAGIRQVLLTRHSIVQRRLITRGWATVGIAL